MKSVLVTLGVLIVLGVLGAAAVIYSGVFNVAATVTDAPPLRWVFVTTREASIKRHARDIQAPALGGAHVIAFVMTLPKMNAADYDALDRRVPSNNGTR